MREHVMNPLIEARKQAESSLHILIKAADVKEKPVNEIKKRGFGSMTPARRQEISSRGGVAAHKKGTAHEWNAAEASIAGKLGQVALSKKRNRVPAPEAIG